jgi:hypothetical protein
MTDKEQLLVECIRDMLDQKVRLGLPPEPPKDGGYNDPRLRGLPYLHGQIDEMFANKAAELTHYTGVCAAFSKIHNYKYLDDPLFLEALDREMVGQGIPATERQKALRFVPDILRELKEELDVTATGLTDLDSPERGYGFHPNLYDVLATSQPPQYKEQDANKDD